MEELYISMEEINISTKKVHIFTEEVRISTKMRVPNERPQRRTFVGNVKSKKILNFNVLLNYSQHV